MDGKELEPFVPEDVCHGLRTKTMMLNPGARRRPEIGASRASTAHFWCLATMAAHGPDDEDVLPHYCRPDRSCWHRANPS